MTDKRSDRALEASRLFEGLLQAERRSILEISLTRRFHRDNLIFSEGEAARGFFLIVSGKVKVFKVSPEGKEQILHIFGPGEVVGEVPVFSGNAFPASAAVLQDSEILFIPREGFRRMAMARPQILWNMLGTLSRRLREFTVQIERLSLQEVASRLAGVLLEMAEASEGGGPGVAQLRVTKGQLASQIGTAPETLSRSLKKMTLKGLIDVQKKRILILDRAALEDVASGGGSLES